MPCYNFKLTFFGKKSLHNIQLNPTGIPALAEEWYICMVF